jgi:hypothetical protein
MLSPSVSAAIILVLVCGLGAYYINSVHGIFSDTIERFFNRNAAQDLCEKEYNKCLTAGFSNTDCTTENEICIAAANKANPGIYANTSSATNAPSTRNDPALTALKTYSNKEYGAAAATALAATRAPGSGYASSGFGRLGNGSDAGSGSDGSWKETPGYTGGWQRPTTVNAAAIMDALYAKRLQDQKNEAEDSTYIPSQIFIRPHDKPVVTRPPPTGNVKSDDGTLAQDIKDAGYSSTVRQMIRNDVKKAVREEVQKINNEYEVVYE